VSRKELKEEIILYTVARMNFQRCYPKIKALTKDIDGISKNQHFHFIVRRTG
jgi:hypothetical protein